MKNITCRLILALILFPLAANCLTVTGRVLDSDGYPFPGVTVIIKGTRVGTITDFDGKFELEVEKLGTILLFSMIGTEDLEAPVTKADMGDIVLQPDLYDLDEVVVVGYGTVKSGEPMFKRSRTKSSSKVIKSKPSKSKSKLVDKSSDDNESTSAGQLTAGEVNDFSKWNLWNDKSQDELRIHQNIWKISPANRFTVMVQNEDGFPMIGEKVHLLDKEKNTVWTAITDNVGKAELWANMFEKKYSEEYDFSIILNSENETYTIDKASPFKEGINHITINKGCEVNDVVDVVFVVDATGSMGDEIEYLKVELNDVINKIKKNHKDLTFNMGCVFYRDHGEEYVVKSSDLSDDISKTIKFIKDNSAAGGGDNPEAIDEALKVAINDLSWNSNSRTKLIFTLLDAPPHQDTANLDMMHEAAYKAAEKGIKIVPIAASGIDKSAEYLMRSLALCTNGTYVFLTDDSGIGNAHIKPTTDTFTVETLNDIFIRLFYQFTNVVTCNMVTDLPNIDSVVVIENIIPKVDKDIFGNNDSDDTTDKSDSDSQSDNNEDDDVQIEEAFKCLFYPNPTSGVLNIDIDGNVKELFLSDISGKLLQRFDVDGESNLTVNISQYPRGIYLMTYFGNSERPKTGKIILSQ